jgi:choline monooxygenase
MLGYHVDEDISKAETLPASFYRCDETFEHLKQHVFRRSFQWYGSIEELLPMENYIKPLGFIDGFIEEPIFLRKDEKEGATCFSNVCTHRGNLIFHHEGPSKQITCGYHGRTWNKDGSFKFMPEFSEVKNFPRACDHLKKYTTAFLGPQVFVGLNSTMDIDAVFSKMNERIGFLPLEEFKHDKKHSKDYIVNCHWALYCDNYLEGFHIPFVHDDLNAVLDYGSYTTELFENGSLQIGYSSGGEDVFDLPAGHPDEGKSVAAYYYWVFPNMMFNFYPWGLSVNVVRPVSKNKTRVLFRSYVWDSSKLSDGAGSVLDKVEREDEFVVEGVHKGLQSETYQSGRFSPTREQGVHHFHRLLANALN